MKKNNKNEIKNNEIEVLKLIKKYINVEDTRPVVSLKGNPNSVGTSSGGCQLPF
ncbi:MAG: hypothetical protein ACP5IZ_11675 [Thermoprotei archaeon]|jgi:hypothetical protein